MLTLFKNARILKMNDEDIFLGDLIVKDNKIIYVGESKKHDQSFDRVIDCNGNLLMPGFKNCHTHSAMTFLRSYADDMPLQEWLFGHCIPAEKNLRPDDIYYLAKLAFLEYLTSGITACFDMYFFPNIFKKASEDLGMRSVIALMPTTRVTNEELIAFYEDCNKKDSLVTAIWSLHSEYTTSKEEVDLINELVHKYKAPFYSHLSETKKEVEECYERRGVSPIKYFADLGLFDYGGGGYHCVHLSDDDVEIFAKKKLTVVTNPGSNTKLASGICDVDKLLKNKVNVTIGTDGPASNNCLDMFKEMTLVSSLAKVSKFDAASVPADEILKMATVNGSDALLLKDARTLEEGQLADIIMIDLTRPNMRPFNNIKKNIVYSGSKENIKMTTINGKILYEDGKFYVDEDVETIYEKAEQISKRLIEESKNG